MNEIALSEKVTTILNSKTKFSIALTETVEALFDAMQAESAIREGTTDLFRPQADLA